MNTVTNTRVSEPSTAERVRALPAYSPDLELADAERLAAALNARQESSDAYDAQMREIMYGSPPFSYLRLGNLMRFGAFWVVLGAIIRYLTA